MKQKKLEKMYLNKEHRYGLREKEKPSITSLFSILNFKTKSDATRDKTQQRFTAPQSDATWLRFFFQLTQPIIPILLPIVVANVLVVSCNITF